MKNWKKLLALLLTVCLCACLLAACSNKTEAPQEDNPAEQPEDPGTTPEEPEEEPEGEPEEDTEEEPEEFDEITEINAVFLYLGANKDATLDVEAAINEISEQKVGVHINITYLDFGEYMTQVGMQIAAGDPLDLVWMTGVPGTSFATLNANGQLMDIAPYLQEDYAAGLMETVGDYLGAFTYNGGIYGLPCYRTYVSNNYLVMRRDMLQELGMEEKAENASSWAEISEIMYAVHDAYPEMAAITRGAGRTVLNVSGTLYNGASAGADFSESFVFDNVGDATELIYVDENGIVSPIYEQEGYIDVMKLTKQWYDDGVVYADAPTQQEMGQSYVKDGVVFSVMMTGEIGIEQNTGTGYDSVCLPVVKGMIKTSALTGWGLGVPVTCTEPEATVRFLNLLYTDADVATILAWGVEGRDWTRLESGEADYPEGVDAASVPYHGGDFIVGNQFLVLPWAGQGGDFREVALADDDNAVVSPFLGFALDTRELANEIAGLTAVNDQYLSQLNCGLYSDGILNEMIAQCEAAGIDTYIAAVQSQLDAWRTEQ